MRSAAEINRERLMREARASEHHEAYQSMGKHEGTSVGVGARATGEEELAFFIEVLIPFCSGSQVDLDELEGKLETLKQLKKEGFSLTCQDDMSICCELVTRLNDAETKYTRVVSLIEQSHLG